MNTKNITIGILKEKIYKILEEEIGGKDVCLLDLPNYYNPGDQLIWEGEEQLLRKLNINIKYRASHYFFNSKMVSKDDCILLHGGGNFGDLYEHHHKFKESIIKKFPENKIIVLSSTVHFSNKNNLRTSVQLFSKHPNVTILARDENSFKILQENFKKNKCYLIPDMAFTITTSKKPKNKQALFLLRTDDEKSYLHKNSLDFINNLHVSDWDTYNQNTIGGNVHWWATNINKVLLRFWKLRAHWNKKNDVYGLIKVHSREKQIKTAINFFSPYDLIITTRLHGHILACLLGIPNIVLDNNYGKNKNFYHTWMNNNPFNAYYANSVEEVHEIIKNNFPEFIK